MPPRGDVAVVGRHDDRVVPRIERRDDAPDEVVDGGERGAVLGRPRAVLVRRLVGMVDVDEGQIGGRHALERVGDVRLVDPPRVHLPQALVAVRRHHCRAETGELRATEHRVQPDLAREAIAQHSGGGGLDARRLRDELRTAEARELGARDDVEAVGTKAIQDRHPSGGIEPEAVDQDPHETGRSGARARRRGRRRGEHRRARHVEIALVALRRPGDGGREHEDAAPDEPVIVGPTVLEPHRAV